MTNIIVSIVGDKKFGLMCWLDGIVKGQFTYIAYHRDVPCKQALI